jgi:hypothetical protein
MLKNVRIYKGLQLPLRSVLGRFGSSYPLFTLVRGRGILRSSSNRISAKFRIAPVLCNRSSYVEYGGAEPDVHKTLIIPLGCIYGPSYSRPSGPGLWASRVNH